MMLWKKPQPPMSITLRRLFNFIKLSNLLKNQSWVIITREFLDVEINTSFWVMAHDIPLNNLSYDKKKDVKFLNLKLSITISILKNAKRKFSCTTSYKFTKITLTMECQRKING